MSEATAEAYAKSLAESIWENDKAGYPFGVASDDNPVTDRENGEELSAMDYLSDVLDIQYIVSGEREYRAAHVLIAFGGPNAWINTQTGNLEVSWWSPVVYESLPSTYIDALDDALEELWEMGA